VDKRDLTSSPADNAPLALSDVSDDGGHKIKTLWTSVYRPTCYEDPMGFYVV